MIVKHHRDIRLSPASAAAVPSGGSLKRPLPPDQSRDRTRRSRIRSDTWRPQAETSMSGSTSITRRRFSTSFRSSRLSATAGPRSPSLHATTAMRWNCSSCAALLSVPSGVSSAARRSPRWQGWSAELVELTFLFRRARRPDVLLCASRSSALAARWMGIPSFVIDDYEYANSSFYRLTRSTILHPDVIDPAPFLESGIGPNRLMAFHGLKEDISLAGVDVDEVVPHRFPEIQDEALVRVLFRPPAEQSHYYDPKSRDFALRTLGHLAAKPEAVVVFSPRHRWQQADLKQFVWVNKPIVLERGCPFRLTSEGRRSRRLLRRHNAQGGRVVSESRLTAS